MTENGRLFAEKAGEKIEVVIATAKQAAAFLVEGRPAFMWLEVGILEPQQPFLP